MSGQTQRILLCVILQFPNETNKIVYQDAFYSYFNNVKMDLRTVYTEKKTITLEPVYCYSSVACWQEMDGKDGWAPKDRC